MALVSPHKPFPVTKPRAWTMQETRIPPRPSPSTASRNESRRVMVLNPAFQMLNQPQYSGNEAEEDMQPTLMEAPRRQVPPRRVTKTEKLNVLRECRWDVSGDVDAKDESVSGRVSLSRPLIVLLGAVCLTSLLSMLLTLLILFGTVGARKCSCNANEGPAPDVQEDKGIPVDELLKNMTSLEKRLVARIEKLEKLGSEEKDKLAKQVEKLQNELDDLKLKHVGHVDSLWSVTNFTRDELHVLKNVTVTLTTKAKQVEKLQNELDDLKRKHVGHVDSLWSVTNSTRDELHVLKNVTVTLITKAKQVEKLQNELDDLKRKHIGHVDSLWSVTNSTRDELDVLKNVTITLTTKVDNEFATVWLNLNKSKESCKNVNSTLQTFKTEVEINLRNVWSSVNKTSECCSNMMTSLQSLTSEVTIDFQTLRARVKIEEDKSNKSSETAVQHSKDIAALETSLNSTRQEVKVLSLVWISVNSTEQELQQQTHALWTARNFTQKEVGKLWSAVNSTSTKLQQELGQVQANLSAQVNNNFVTLRSRIEMEEHKTNESSRRAAVQHSKDIAALEKSLNSTRQEVKELSLVWITVNSTEEELQQQTHALWTARNSTQEEVSKLWSAVNSTRTELQQQLGTVRNSSQNDIHHVWTVFNLTNKAIQQQLGEVTHNLTLQLNYTREVFQSRDTSLFASLVAMNTTLINKVNNVTKMSGPAGLQGYNGSQGPAGAQGPAGPAGPQGAQGAGDFTQCKYKLLDSGGSTSGPTYSSDTSIPEPTGKKIVGATCSTNHAAEYIFSASLVGVVQYYTCQCRGEAAKFPSYGVQTHCYLHYWECPSTT